MSLADFKSTYEWREIKLHLSRTILELMEKQSVMINNMKNITETNIELIKDSEKIRCYKELIELPDTLFSEEEKKKEKKAL